MTHHCGNKLLLSEIKIGNYLLLLATKISVSNKTVDPGVKIMIGDLFFLWDFRKNGVRVDTEKIQEYKDG